MQKSIKTALFKKAFNLKILNDFLSGCLPWNLYTSKDFIKKRETIWVTEKMGGFKHHNGYWWTPVLSKHLS